MAYVLNLFTPSTWSAFSNHGKDITGFSRAHLSRARNLVNPGDTFICYMVRLSRWCGALKVLEGPFEDSTPIFEEQNDPWVVRFKVQPLITLSPEQSIPIRDPLIWNHLERTKKISLNSPSWPVRAGLQSSLVKITDPDGTYLLKCLTDQARDPAPYPLAETEQKFLSPRTDVVSTPSGPISVLVPDSNIIADQVSEQIPEIAIRRSLQIQATLVSIGVRLGFDVWIPKSDGSRLAGKLADSELDRLVGRLPLNYNDATLKTIENIDVLWLRKRRIVRAFEVEHTTAIYSGLLRMADLLALQPNIDIKLHIVAPVDRRDRVLEEIRRPVFSLLEKGPLADSCSYLPYEAIEELAAERHLEHMTDSIVDEFVEYASES